MLHTIRPAVAEDAEALLSAPCAEGHLPPRSEEIRRHADRFMVAERGARSKRARSRTAVEDGRRVRSLVARTCADQA